MPKGKFYGVARGRTVGVFEAWRDAKAATDHFPNALHAAFATRDEAAQFVAEHSTVSVAASESTPSGTVADDAARERLVQDAWSQIALGADAALLTAPLRDHVLAFLRGDTDAIGGAGDGVETHVLRRDEVDGRLVMLVLELHRGTGTWRKLLRKSALLKSEPLVAAAAAAASPGGDLVTPVDADSIAELTRRAAAQLASSPLARVSSQSFGAAAAVAAVAPLDDAIADAAAAAPVERKKRRRLDKQPAAAAAAAAVAADVVEVKPKPAFSPDQQRAFDLVMSGANVFLTGSGGSGKSFLLAAIVSALNEENDNDPRAVAITASTGAAALNIRGSTLHSWAGIGLGTEPDINKLAAKVHSSKFARQRWMRVCTLIIDEVSMISAELFEKIEFIARYVRARERGKSSSDMPPFGGIQVLLCGDFLQLPPVNKSGPNVYAFETAAWQKVVQHTCVLRSVFRQTDDAFVRVLNELRRGIFSDEAKEMLRQRVGATVRKPVRLCARRADVDAINEVELERLKSEAVVFEASDFFRGPSAEESQQQAKRLDDSCLAVSTLVLKKGAQVLLLRNLDVEGGLVNGSQGTVIDFKIAPPPPPQYERKEQRPLTYSLEKKYPVVLFLNGCKRIITPECWSIEQDSVVQASRTQVPLLLAWAITVHKAQGMTLDAVVADVSSAFATGQAYVALSRVRSLDGLSLTSMPHQFLSDPRVVEWYKRIDRDSGVSTPPAPERVQPPVEAKPVPVPVHVPEPVPVPVPVAAAAPSDECVVCFERAREVAFECGHFICCSECANLPHCPMCRAAIDPLNNRKIFKS